MQKKIIIIGATSGIGKEMAHLYLARGYKVGITGRRCHLLQQIKALSKGRVHTACFDVTAEKGLKALLGLIDEMEGMDVLIYNAGFGEVAKDLNEQIELTTAKTNVMGMVQITSFAFNYFLKKGKGQIAIISSVAALRGNGMAPAYSASKAFGSLYAEGLNLKAAHLGANIVVTDIKPGFINTKPENEGKRFWVIPAHKAASQIVAAIENKKRKAYITHRWWLLAQLFKILPFWLYKRLGNVKGKEKEPQKRNNFFILCLVL